MPRLLMLKGLPASGKSTFARKLVHGEIRDMGGNWVRVNKDDLRNMLHDGKFSRPNEKDILKVRDYIVAMHLEDGKSVVVDDTNFASYHEEALRGIASKFDAKFEHKFIDLDPKECIRRDLERPKSVGQAVIMQMYNQYLKPTEEAVAVPKHIEGVPWAIICDIDGTLAKMKDRGPYDWKRVGEDEVVREVIFVLERMKFDTKIDIILVSGRDGVCRPETEAWLKKYAIDYDMLFMRPEGDNQKDSVIKQLIYDTQIKGNYNIAFVLDDRDQVVKMWRANGLKCFQVAEGSF